MQIPQSLRDIPFVSEVNFTYARLNMFAGKVPDTPTDEDENAAIMAAVIDCNLWNVALLEALPFSLSADIGLLSDAFRLVEGDVLSIVRLYVHLKNIINHYEVDKKKFDENYHFQHAGTSYTIYRKAVKNAITGDFMYDVSYDCGQSAMEVQRVWSDAAKKDDTGTEFYNFHLRQLACIARSSDCKTMISPFDRANETAKKIAAFEDIKSDVIRDLVFFLHITYRDLGIIPDTNSFLRAYPFLEQLVIQATITTRLENKAIESFNKQAWS